MQGHMKIKGARENNLNNISVEIPKFKLVVVTGPSGSGKSTLAMDTLQRECQRQYMESMGMVADSISKPKVDSIEGLSPSISVGQHVTNRNPRSTIGTVTDIYTLLRILFAKVGERPCPSCGAVISPSYAEEDREREIAMQDEEAYGSQAAIACRHCGHAADALTMSHFSFNKPEGACEVCDGLGHTLTLNMEAVFDEEQSLRGGGVKFWYDLLVDYNMNILKACASHYGFAFDEHLPLKDYSEVQRDLLYHGAESQAFSRHFPGVKPPKTVREGKFEGVVTGIWRRYREKGGDSGAEFFYEQVCPGCEGARLKKESRLVLAGGASITDVTSWPLAEALAWMNALRDRIAPDQFLVVEDIIHDMAVRVKRIIDVGLGYMTLNRQVVTMSGGEAQRLRLASVLGSGLTGVLYILDEPTAGLHPRDTRGLIQVLEQLRDMGNTVLVIEHDEEVMRAADHIIDMGPGAGRFGGQVVGQGTLEELMQNPDSVTGAYFREEGARIAPIRRRPGNGGCLMVRDAHLRNLKHVTASFPLGCLISVTGVSGSGKSTLLFELLAASGPENVQPSGCGGITGWETVGQLVTVDQSPLGRMQRSNVATYTDVYTHLRNWYAGLPEAKRSKLTAKHFSFNTAGGRCEACQGLGVVPVHMHFLPELEVRCPSCRGTRFKPEILQVTYKGHSISDLLDMTIQESLELLGDLPKITAATKLLCDVGLGYLKWGQSVRTLSGGEAQRLKLAAQLSRPAKHHTLYVLDEPSTGLHPRDVRQLEVLLHRLVDAGNTVIIVEHNLDLIWGSDWVIDIGPGGGEAGGNIVAAGTPDEIAACPESHTGIFLRAMQRRVAPE
ncbi:excinuclease ABC subunit UvrA [Paenibacillus melissococcoides]|uniref:UvrABC system protein A n=1 Tax=Paenibacillus melissococcoides TaxID=2912268 RepID=A0ABN8U603_9BACL|nr:MULTISPECIES: excinuclease ABC subunit UvrA [Paenibacillus]GIO82482.1 excinuclease ABC subunit A [Paenibacillus dendritiformis]CAH8246458.1 excinuclease ABC subunit UvrA [Paenibacillus melissococcoides]CAH8714806.1 excinuclease ABC subunit UvrA [Paenibacillus melissococcoides]CAH8715760.1 excinuclease ABC subunit UvrA [Paenibacillus melissococcoides]